MKIYSILKIWLHWESEYNKNLISNPNSIFTKQTTNWSIFDSCVTSCKTVAVIADMLFYYCGFLLICYEWVIYWQHFSRTMNRHPKNQKSTNQRKTEGFHVFYVDSNPEHLFSQITKRFKKSQERWKKEQVRWFIA